MLKKFKMLLEVVAKKETENGSIGLKQSWLFMKDIVKIMQKHKFECYVKGYPKDKLNYEPTGKSYKIETIEDIAELSAKQFEFFIDDLREYCNMQRQIKAANNLVGADVIQSGKGMTWLDTGLNESKINFVASNKI